MTSCILPIKMTDVKMTTTVEDKMTTTEIDVTKYIEEPHTIIDACFNGRHLERLIEHQIESYNEFITNQIPQTIEMFNPVSVRSEHTFHTESKKYGLLNTHPSGQFFKNVPEEYRKIIPDYIKNYVPLNKFVS